MQYWPFGPVHVRGSPCEHVAHTFGALLHIMFRLPHLLLLIALQAVLMADWTFLQVLYKLMAP